MFDDLVDRVIGRVMTGAGFVVAAGIAAVAAAMAIFAFASRWIGPAWAYVIVAIVAAAVVAIWALLQRSQRQRARKPSFDQRILDALHAHPPAAFLAGIAAASLARGKPRQAAAAWRARKSAGL